MAKNVILKKLICDEIIADLKTIMKASSINLHKSKVMQDYLGDFGFKYIGQGTNRLVMRHKKHKGLVFKFALDSFGAKDNLIDMVYSEQIENYVTTYECHATGFVNICEEVNIIKTDNEIRRYYKQMKKLLNELSEDYLLCDMSLLTPRNFGWVAGKKGKKILVLADGSDMVPLTQGVTLRCNNKVRTGKKHMEFDFCGGKLEYDADYAFLVCNKCGKSYNPTELYTEKYKEVDVLKDKYFSLGLTDRELKNLSSSIIREREALAKHGDNPVENTEEAIRQLKEKMLQDDEEETTFITDIETDKLDDYPEPICDMNCDECTFKKCKLEPADEEDTDNDDDDSSEDNDSDDYDSSEDNDSDDYDSSEDNDSDDDDDDDKPSYTGATIFEGSDYTRRDLSVIHDQTIRVELDEVGDEIKTIDILIDGEIPEESKISFNVNQIQASGTPIQKVIPLTEFFKFIENYQSEE